MPHICQFLSNCPKTRHGYSVPLTLSQSYQITEILLTSCQWSSQILNRHQARWVMFLSNFNFHLTWAPGKANITDAPSRHPDFLPKKGDETLLGQNCIILTPKHTELLTPSKNIQSNSPGTINAMTTLSIDNSTLFKRFKIAFREDTEWREALVCGNSDFTSENGLVFHKGKLFVPSPLCTDILFSHHDAIIAGHPGCIRTFGLVSHDYSWPGMQTYVWCYVEACDTCARIKTPCHKPYGLLQPLDIPARPWKSISMDFIVKLLASHNYDSI